MIQEFEETRLKKNVPSLRSGYTVRLSQKIKEGEKERLQAFEGLVIKIAGSTPFNRTVTVRKVIDGIGVEKIVPIHSPNLAKIEVIKKSKVRRAKLYYLRGKEGHKVKLYEKKDRTEELKN